MSDPQVSRLQELLNQLRAAHPIDEEPPPALVVDGILGPLTRARCQDFQNSWNRRVLSLRLQKVDGSPTFETLRAASLLSLLLSFGDALADAH